jgi:hypothetical protein
MRNQKKGTFRYTGRDEKRTQERDRVGVFGISYR